MMPGAAAAPRRFTTATVAEQAAARAGTLTKDKKIALLLPVGSEANLAPIIAAFEAASGIRVSTQYAPVDDISTFLLLANSSKNASFDIALPPTFALADLAEAGAIIPLTEFIDRYEPEDYGDDLLYRHGEQVDGAFYGYQTDGDVYLSFINERLLSTHQHDQRFADRYGRRAGEIATWQEMDQLMAFYHQPDSNIFGGSLFRTASYALWEFWLRLHAAGIAPFDDDMRPQITLEPAVDALAALVAATSHQEPKARINNLFQNWRSFARGNSLINIGWGGSQKAFYANGSRVRGHTRTMLPPGGEIGAPGLPYFNWGWNYTVPRRSTQPEIGYLFSLFACSPSVSTLAVRQADGYFDPFRTNHYADERIKGTYSQDFLEVHEQGMQHCIPDCYVPGQSDYFDALSRYVALAIAEQLTPREALKTAARRWEQITSRRGHDQQARSWQQVLRSYPMHVQTKLRGVTALSSELAPATPARSKGKFGTALSSGRAANG